jgi:hypothetical protein
MKRRIYRIDAAIAYVAKHGFTEHCLDRDAVEANREVTLHQDWWPKGDEVVRFKLAWGKYRGNSIGFATRPERN